MIREWLMEIVREAVRLELARERSGNAHPVLAERDTQKTVSVKRPRTFMEWTDLVDKERG